MRSYTVLPVTGKPCWDEIPSLAVNCVLWGEDTGIRMCAQLCYDRENLYVRQRAWEKEIRATHTGYLQQVCEDSCMEFFFAPGAKGDERYFNVEINPNGCVHLGFRLGRKNSVQVVPKEMEKLLAVCPERTEDGWMLTYRIPVTLVQLFYPGFHWEKGREFRANCFKCGDCTRQPHYLSWNPVTSETPDFHRYCDFGRMIFA